jgi:hypothetical protein
MLQRRTKYKRVHTLWIAGLLFLLINGCAKDEGPFIVKPVKLPGDTLLSLSTDIQPIFDSHCIRCHNQSHPFLDLRDGYSYNQLLYTGHLAPYIDTVNPENSILVGRLRGVEYPIMPPDGDHLLPATIDSIVLWMSEGARE